MNQAICDFKAENAVIGSILVDPDLFYSVESFLTKDDFHNTNNVIFFQVIQEIYTEGNMPDILLVRTKAKQQGIDDKNLSGKILALFDTSYSTVNGMQYAKIVSRLATLRRLVGFAQKSVQLAYSSRNVAIDETFTKVHQMLDAVSPEETDKCLLLWKNSLDAFYEMQLGRIAELDAIEKGELTQRITFPWYGIRKFIRWLRPGMFGIVASDSSVGKTTFLECCADFWAKGGLHVVFFHLELSHQFMLDRRMCRWSGEPLEIIESGQTTQKMAEATWRVKQWPGGIHYVHCPGWSANRIANYIRMLYNKGICDIFLGDYFQKMKKQWRKGQNEASAYGDTAEIFKNVCEQLGICGLLGSQMNRYSKQELRRTASGIRGSGELEEKANVVITLDRKILTQEYFFNSKTYQEGERSPIMKIRVDKNTAGPTGDAELVMIAERFLITDPAKEKGV